MPRFPKRARFEPKRPRFHPGPPTTTSTGADEGDTLQSTEDASAESARWSYFAAPPGRVRERQEAYDEASRLAEAERQRRKREPR